MNKKIEDAAKEYADKETPENAYYDLYNEVITERHDSDCLYTWSREDKSFAFRAGAEWALRAAIEICKGHTGMFSSIKESATAGTIKEEIEQLLSSEDKNDQR